MRGNSRQYRSNKRKRRMEQRLRRRRWREQDQPMFRASNIHYDVADRLRGLAAGGIGAVHLLAQRTGLIEAIDEHLHLLKIHLPYHESDHVLNIAYNILCGGACLEDLELLRNNEVYLDALDTQRIPDPTTAGDFCRRFGATDVESLQQALNDVRVKVWREHARADPSFFDEAIIEADGTLAPTWGECKAGMDISHTGTWGYHPLIVSLANTAEPLFLDNRSGNRPSYEGAAERFDQAIALCKEAGFAKITLRGDTDFSQTHKLDGWDELDNVRFIFGMDAQENLKAISDNLGETQWNPLQRPTKYTVKTKPRKRPDNVKEEIVRERKFKNIRLKSEDVAEFSYSPTKCKKTYRLVVVRKNLSVEQGEWMLYDDIRYFFYITNDWQASAEQIVFEANARCDQENLLGELKHGVKALRMPVDTLTSNHAYMVMASLAWTLKAWYALLLPVSPGPWAVRHRAQRHEVLRMKFKRFVNTFIIVPCQIVRTGRRVVYRLLSWNNWQGVLLRAADAWRTPMRC